ncbi:MAG: DMT family transporter [Acidipropionibacterium sp.]|jgi:drug/metabolite transporter (DMT)-like permease|nr:DMT family transporter [Acidipropionibacterium sp.]
MTGNRRAAGDNAMFVVLGILWGASFLLIKYGLRGLSPAQVGLGRLGIGAATLSLVALRQGRRWAATIRQHLSLLAVGVFMFVIPVNLYSWAGQYIPSAVSSILNATTPIMTVVVSAVFLRNSPPTSRQVLGVLIGAGGILLVVRPWSAAGELEGRIGVLAMLACLGATASYAVAYVLMAGLLSAPAQESRGAPAVDPVTGTAEELIWAAAVCAAISGPLGAWGSPVVWRADMVIAMVVLGVFSTGLGYLLNTRLTESMGSVKASQVTYVTPIVGVLLGWALLGEALGAVQIVGGCVVLIGIWITRSRARGVEVRP